MMACGGGGDLNACDSISGPKLRPVFPRPTCVNARYPAISPMVNPSFRNFTLYPNLSSLNPRPAFVAKQSSTKINEKPFTSSRWYPTAEQLLTLEELYRRGTRTPTVEQIQEIAAYLGRFGKIQGKNVFYWFQNHKARERRKLRREMGSHLPEQQHKRKSPDNREPVTRRTDEVILAKKKWATFLDSQRLSEGSDNSMGRAATAESMTIEGLQFEERKSKQSRRTVGRPGTWQIVPMPWSPLTHQSLIRTSSDTKFSNTHYVMPLAPTKTVFSELEDQRREPKTLNLFPPHVCVCDDNSSSEKDNEVPIPTNENNFVPNRFFEFLPLKS